MPRQKVRRDPNDQLGPVKLPKWFRVKAAQVAAQTDEHMGQVIVRLCRKALDREHAAKVVAKVEG